MFHSLHKADKGFRCQVLKENCCFTAWITVLQKKKGVLDTEGYLK